MTANIFIFIQMNINYTIGLFMIFLEYNKKSESRVFNASSGTSVASSAVGASSGTSAVVASSAVVGASSGTSAVVASSAVVGASVASSAVARHPVAAVVVARHRSSLEVSVRQTYSMLYTNAIKKILLKLLQLFLIEYL